MTTQKSWTARFFGGIWSVLNFTRSLFFNLVFIAIILIIIGALMTDDHQTVVPKESALILNIQGDIVIQTESIDPFDELMMEAADNRRSNPEVLLQDIVFAIDNAAEDNRIKTLILSLGRMRNAGQDKLRAIADAIERFKATGKAVYAVGDYYNQKQYYLASHADHLYLNPMGMVFIEGYGRYRMYYKTALEKLKATTHIFRVGTFKSAVEPFIRDDMSDYAKEANQEWLNALWENYKQDVAKAREMDLSNFDEKLDSFIAKFEDSNGDFAQYALTNGWVDALKDREAIRTEMISLVGKDDNKLGFNYVDFYDYIELIKPPFDMKHGDSNVGIVVAKGTIYNGSQKPGSVGGDSTARLLRKARLDDTVKAVVLYVDSPGGSAFASEVIRQEIVNLKEAGKPVVAMMSSVAASGGYWISASADQIWASPSTITGSIGIFGMFMTYEDTLDYLGVHTDGVGTTEFAGLSATQKLDPRVGKIFQRSIEHGYDNFISLVAKERNMSKEDVDKIAQGRVWVGSKAQEIGLVDHLGNFDDAVKAAAELANMTHYDEKYIEPTLSARERFWKEFFGDAALDVAKAVGHSTAESKLMQQLSKAINEIDTFSQFNDPRGAYAFCIMCDY